MDGGGIASWFLEQGRRHPYGAVADKQIARLRERLGELVARGKVAQEQVDAIIACLKSKREAAVDAVMAASIPDGHLPLLAVVSKESLAVSIQMPMVKHGDEIGVSHLTDDNFTDGIGSRKDIAWWAIDVENGKQFCDGKTSSKDDEAIITQQGRICCVVAEAIALGIHDNVLEHHNVLAPGSRYNNEVPDLCLDDVRPAISCYLFGYAIVKWGTASLRKRV
ncbi:MAG: hypothetical protein WC768_02945 [Patescibacteria group bacterium]|jgi:hypothetical protein